MLPLIFKICLFLPVATLVIGHGYRCRVPADPRGVKHRQHIFNPQFPLKEDCASSNCFWEYTARNKRDLLKLNCSVVDFSDNTQMELYQEDTTRGPYNYTLPFTATSNVIRMATKNDEGCYSGRFHCTLDPPGEPSDKCNCRRNPMTFQHEFSSKAALVLNYEICLSCGDVMIIGSRLAVTTAHILYGKDPQNYALLAGGHNISGMTMEEKEPLLTDVTAFIIHKDYDPGHLLNDFAMVVLAEDLVFSPTIQRACIRWTRPYQERFQEPAPSQYGVAPPCLLMALPPNVCQMKYGEEFDEDQHFCVYRAMETCLNNTSPVYHTDASMVYGVGVISHRDHNCGMAHPKIASRLAYFVITMIQNIYPEAELCWDGTAHF